VGLVLPGTRTRSGSTISGQRKQKVRVVRLEGEATVFSCRADYLTVQQIYRGWALLGFVVTGALLSTLVLTIMVRTRPQAFVLALVAFVCLVGTQGVFWTFTFPTNQQTSNWTVLPENWEALRTQWEYSHAASAVLNLLALVALSCAVFARRREPEDSLLCCYLSSFIILVVTLRTMLSHSTDFLSQSLMIPFLG